MRLLFERTLRMLEEVRGLHALMAEVEWLSHVEWGLTASADVRVNFDITVQGKVYEAELVYPSLFPEAPAYVRPRKPDQAWSGHQYVAGTLCLEWGPDNWHPGVTGAALVRNTFLLMAYEVVGPALGMEAPSRHELTTGQRLRGVVNRFLVTPELKAVIAAAPANMSPLTVATNARLGALVAMVTKVGEASAPNLAGVPPEICDPNALGSWLRTGWVIKVDDWASLPKDAAPAAVHDFLVAKGCWPCADEADRTRYLLLVDAQGGLRPIALVLGEAARVYEYTLLDASSDVARVSPSVIPRSQIRRSPSWAWVLSAASWRCRLTVCSHCCSRTAANDSFSAINLTARMTATGREDPFTHVGSRHSRKSHKSPPAK